MEPEQKSLEQKNDIHGGYFTLLHKWILYFASYILRHSCMF